MMDRFFIGGWALLFVSTMGFASSPAVTINPVFGPHPRLATTPEELNLAKTAPDFATERQKIVDSANVLMKNPATLPDGYANWVFYYACPEDAVRLKPISLTQHRCPKCGTVYSDERTVTASRALLHYAAEKAANTLGWAYAYTGDEKYVEGVKRILLKLAHDYPTYPQRLDRWGHVGIFAPLGGRRFVQSLDEATGIISLAEAYDLTFHSPSWSPEEKATVEKNLFKLTANTLLAFNQGINNHQTWYNAGLMAIASVTADAELIKKVLTMRGGFSDQLERSIGPDGLWYEGSVSYHSYAFSAMRSIVETGERLGLPLANEPKFRAMIEGLLHVTYPHGVFPAINDSDPITLTGFSKIFEWAWKQYHDPTFAQAAAWNNPEKLKALLGPDAKPQSPISTGSENLAGVGLTVLRQGEGSEATCLFLDYGRHGGGHGHYDKLNIMLYSNGREWLLDPGRLNYSHKEYKTWVKETAAHNTVTLAGQNQKATTGQFLFLQTDKEFTACAAQSKSAYPGATLTRYLLLTPKILVDVFAVEAPKTTQIDLFAHAVAAGVLPVTDALQGRQQSPGKTNGYQHFQDGKVWLVRGDSRWDFVSDLNNVTAPRLRLWLAGNSSEQIFTATGIGHAVSQKIPTLIRRRNTAKTQFVTVYDLSGSGDFVRDVQVHKGTPSQLTVVTQDRDWKITFEAKGATVRP